MRAIVGGALSAGVLASALTAVRAEGAPPIGSANAAGEPAPTLRSKVYSPYEQAAIDAALAELHAVEDPAPDGKVLEGIDIRTLDVIEPRDPAPGILNTFHATTRHYVIDREILVRPGERYKTVAAEESVRNLRALPQLSVVIAVALRGSGPNAVRLLVITKDVWSLRLAWDLQAVPQGIEDLIIQPSETNFLGTHQVAALDFELNPATLSYGAGYHVPRLEGTRNVIDASASVIFNRASGTAEGSVGSVLAYQPLFSAKTPWAWDSAVTWDEQIARRFVNAAEYCYPATSPCGSAGEIPWEYYTRTYYAQESITRSLGPRPEAMSTTCP